MTYQAYPVKMGLIDRLQNIYEILEGLDFLNNVIMEALGTSK